MSIFWGLVLLTYHLWEIKIGGHRQSFFGNYKQTFLLRENKCHIWSRLMVLNDTGTEGEGIFKCNVLRSLYHIIFQYNRSLLGIKIFIDIYYYGHGGVVLSTTVSIKFDPMILILICSLIYWNIVQLGPVLKQSLRIKVWTKDEH